MAQKFDMQQQFLRDLVSEKYERTLTTISKY